jgi:hypothetical protein
MRHTGDGTTSNTRSTEDPISSIGLKLPVVTERITDPAQWLDRNAFYCPYLVARISHATCVSRQKRRRKRIRAHQTTVEEDITPQDGFCMTGLCPLGAQIRAFVETGTEVKKIIESEQRKAARKKR